MSDTDDTDTLLHIPPNIFSVPSESDGNIETTVVEDLITHVENLATRVNNIETRTSLLGCMNSADVMVNRENFSPSSFESSSNPTLQTVYPAEICSLSSFTGQEDPVKDKPRTLDEVDKYLQSVNIDTMNNSFERATEVNREACGERILDKISTNAQSKHLALPDVDKLLKEMEETQNDIETKLRAREIECGLGEFSLPNRTSDYDSIRKTEGEINRSIKGSNFRSDTSSKAYLLGDNLGSIPDLGLGIRELNQSRLSSLRKYDDPRPPVTEEPLIRRDAYLVGSSSNGEDIRRNSASSSSNTRSPIKTLPQRVPLPIDSRKPRPFLTRRKLPLNDSVQQRNYNLPQPSSNDDHYLDRNVRNGASGDHNEFSSDYKQDHNFQPHALPQNLRTNLLSLADLWKGESNAGHHEDPAKLKQKLEEEKFRRVHLEETIQSLNKRVLEEQEKLAVAMVVDEGKDKAIVQITEAWKQMVEHWKKIEADRHTMSQKLISEKASLKKSRTEVDKKIERWEKEVSQALDLAAGYKSKCEFLEAELTVNKEVLEGKIADLEEKLQVKETTMIDLLEERKSLTEKLQGSKDECTEMRRLNGLSQKETEAVQDNLSKAEAELTVVKEQKDLIEMRLKEEKGRAQLLEQQKTTLETKLGESRESQLKAEDEAKAATAELENSKRDLRNLYQNQLEMVVRSKLGEFQSQLDAAQMAMQAEIESSKEIAQKRSEDQHNALVNSHVSEIRRLEAIHKEEVRCLEIKLAESEQRRAKLENNHKDIAQKLHGVMENQWQQALNILTSELSMRQPHAGNYRVGKYDTRQEKPNHQYRSQPIKPVCGDSEFSEDTQINRDSFVPIRPNTDKTVPSGKQEQLLRYIQMLLDKTPGKAGESSTSVLDSSVSIVDQQNDHLAWAQHNLRAAAAPNEPNAPANQNRKPPWK